MTTTAAPTTEIPTIQRPEHKVAAHIRDAAQKTGVPFEFLLAQANQESRLNPEAKNRRSSAMGLFQFTSNTWLAMVKSHGAEHGLEKYADAITKGADGRLSVKNKDLKKEILDLRRDPALSALMAAEYARDNEQILQARLGRPVSTHDLYLAHFLGAGGALKVLRSQNQPGEDGQGESHGMTKAAQANPDVFTDPVSGEPRSMVSVYSAVERRFRHAMNEANRLTGQLGPQVDLAKLHPAERPDDGTQVAEATTDVGAATSEPRSLGSLYAALKTRFRTAMDEASRIAAHWGPQVEVASLRPEGRPAPQVATASPLDDLSAETLTEALAFQSGADLDDTLAVATGPAAPAHPAAPAAVRVATAAPAPTPATPPAPTPAPAPASLSAADSEGVRVASPASPPAPSPAPGPAADREAVRVATVAPPAAPVAVAAPRFGAEVPAAAPTDRDASAAVSFAGLSSFPTRLPPRPATLGGGAPADSEGEANPSFPIRVPPPVTGARTDAPNLGSLLTANEDRG